MRIVQVVTLFSADGAFGGPTRVAVNQVRELRARGHAVTLVGGHLGAGPPPTEVEGVPVRLFPLRRVVPGTGFAGLTSPALVAHVRSLARNADAVHVHLARDLVTLPSAVLTPRGGPTLVLQTHGMIDAPRNRLGRLLDLVATRSQLRRAHAVLVLSSTERQDVLGVEPAARTVVLGNGIRPVDLSGGDPPAGPVEVLFLARLHPRKRPLHFARAALALAGEFPEVRFTLVGPDEGEGAAVTELLSRDGAHRITWTGPIAPEHSLERMRRASVYVLPSVDEPFPMSVIEAMSVGLPVVVTDTCTLSDVIGASGAGQVSDGSVESLVTALRTLLSSPSLRQEMGRHARHLVETEFDIVPVVDRLVEAYAGPPPAPPAGSGLHGRRVLLVNAYSYRNAGDAAIMIATRDLLTDLGATEVALSSRYPDGTQYERHGIAVHESLVPFPPRGSGGGGDAVRLARACSAMTRALIVVATQRLSPRCTERVAGILTPRALAVARSYDVLAIAGGGYMYSSRRRVNFSLWQSLLSVRLGQALIPGSVMLPQSIGPINTRLDAGLVNWALSRTSVVMRETVSLEQSRSRQLLRLDAATVAPDVAFYGLRSLDLGDGCSTGVGSAKLVRIAVMDWRWSTSSAPEEFEAYLDTVAHVADELVRAGHHVVLGGHSSVAEQDQDDIAWAREVSRRTAGAVAVDEDTDVQHLWNVYRSADLVIGTRLHACIMALAAGTPAIALGYQQKSAGVMEQCGMGDSVFAVDGLDGEVILERAVQLLGMDRAHWEDLATQNRSAIATRYAEMTA